MAVSVRQSTWKMVGANTEREILEKIAKLQENTHSHVAVEQPLQRATYDALPLERKEKKRVFFWPLTKV